MLGRPSLHMLSGQRSREVYWRHFQVPLEGQLLGLVLMLGVVLCEDLLIKGLADGALVQLLLFLEEILSCWSFDTEISEILSLFNSCLIRLISQPPFIFSLLWPLLLFLLLLRLLDLLDDEFLELVILFLLPQLHVKHMVDLVIKLLDQRRNELIIIIISYRLLTTHRLDQPSQLFDLAIFDPVFVCFVVDLTLHTLAEIVYEFFLTLDQIPILFLLMAHFGNHFGMLICLLDEFLVCFSDLIFLIFDFLVLMLQLLEQSLLKLINLLGLLALLHSQVRDELLIPVCLLHKLRLHLRILLICLIYLLFQFVILLHQELHFFLVCLQPLGHVVDFVLLRGECLAEGIDHLENVNSDQLVNVLDLIFDNSYLSLSDWTCEDRLSVPIDGCIEQTFIFIMPAACKIIIISRLLLSVSPLLSTPPEGHIKLVFFISERNTLVLSAFKSRS